MEGGAPRPSAWVRPPRVPGIGVKEKHTTLTKEPVHNVVFVCWNNTLVSPLLELAANKHFQVPAHSARFASAGALASFGSSTPYHDGIYAAARLHGLRLRHDRAISFQELPSDNTTFYCIDDNLARIVKQRLSERSSSACVDVLRGTPSAPSLLPNPCLKQDVPDLLQAYEKIIHETLCRSSSLLQCPTS